MNVLAVDIGNTQIKTGLFDTHLLLEADNFKTLSDLKESKLWLRADYIIISNVNHHGEIENTDNKVFYLTHETSLPIKMNYKTPETLGMDRIAGIVGAWNRFVGNNVLVIDVGTCITYDLILADGVFEGGVIAPGVEMRAKAMHTFTGKLPLVAIQEMPYTDPPGKSTSECLFHGAFTATLMEMQKMIEFFSEKHKNTVIVLCGGGAEMFVSKLKVHIFAAPEIVLVGLNTILQYNVSKLR